MPPPLSSSPPSSSALPDSLSSVQPDQGPHIPLEHTPLNQPTLTQDTSYHNTPPISSDTTSHHIPLPSSTPPPPASEPVDIEMPQPAPPRRPERGSYLDMDEDNPPQTAGSRLSALNPFGRILQSSSTSQTERKSVEKQSISYPQRSSDDSSRPLAFPSLSSPESATFIHTSTSPPQSPISPVSRSHRHRPSVEGVFDSPTPQPRNSRDLSTMLPIAGSSALKEAITSERANSTTSSNGTAPSASTGVSSGNRSRLTRPLPVGENPLIFGPVTPRRISKSVPLPTVEYAPSTSLRAPALSVTSPTPQPSPIKPRLEEENYAPEPSEKLSSALKPFGSLRSSPPKTVTYEEDAGRKSLGKRKSEELDQAAVEAINDKDKEKKKRNSARVSGASNTSTSASAATPPSAFQSTRRHSHKRIKLAAGSQTSSQHGHDSLPASSANSPEANSTFASTSRPGAQPESLHAPSSIAKTKVSRPSTRASFFGANSSQGNLPLSAIVSPRPPSVIQSEYTYYGRGGEEGWHMRDPRRLTSGVHGLKGKVGWKARLPKSSSNLEKGGGGTATDVVMLERETPTPPAGLLFYPGFLLPLLWFIGALLPDRQGSWSSSRVSKENEKEGEAASAKWDQRSYRLAKVRERAFKTWRNRCRFMAILSLVTYLPVIVLIAIFAPS